MQNYRENNLYDVRRMGGFGKKLKKFAAKTAGGLVEDVTGSEALGKGVKKGVKKGSVKKGFKKAVKEAADDD
jgi:hypothetical protein